MIQARAKEYRGFSLVEILVVLILLGLAALLVAPSFTRGLKGVELKAAGRDLITRMKQARTEAIANQTVTRVFLGVDEERRAYYALTDDFGEVQRSFPLPEGVEISTEDEELPLKISFYPNGRSSGGLFMLRRPEGAQVVVSVDPVTGFGRILPGLPADGR